MKRVIQSVLLVSLSMLVLSSCFKDEFTVVTEFSDQEMSILSNTLDLPQSAFDYTVNFPEHLKARNQFIFENDRFGINLNGNQLATLGRVLFYDKKLSKNETISCASCHKQDIGFSDDKKFSEGFAGDLTKRNSLALATTPSFTSSYENGNDQAFFSWDESHFNLQSQSQAAIESEIEMGISMHEAVNRIQGEDYYEVLFKKSFGDTRVDEFRILNALSAFVNSISAINTKFDQGLEESFNHNPDTKFFNFSEAENNGKSLYMENCSSCHGDRLATVAMATANNGLDLIYEDKGKGEVFGFDEFDGIFKVPFLRNIELTAPYMHDGRFETLAQVIDHYSEGIQNHENLSPELKDFPTNKPKKFNFTDQEKASLVAFLNTLTDEGLKTEKKFSDPFKS